MIFHYITHADGRNHTIENEADATDDGIRHSRDNLSKLRNKTKDNRIYGSETNNLWIMDTGKFEYRQRWAIRFITSYRTLKSYWRAEDETIQVLRPDGRFA